MDTFERLLETGGRDGKRTRTQNPGCGLEKPVFVLDSEDGENILF